MPFFHQNLSPNTKRHGHKLPDFEVDFRPRSPTTTPATTPPHTLAEKRRSKLKPDYFWTSPAPVRKISSHTEEEEEGSSELAAEPPQEDIFHLTSKSEGRPTTQTATNEQPRLLSAADYQVSAFAFSWPPDLRHTGIAQNGGEEAHI